MNLPTQYVNACFDNAVRNAQHLQNEENRPYYVIGGLNSLGIHWICANLNSDGSINEFSVVDGDNRLEQIQVILNLDQATSIRNRLIRNGNVEPRQTYSGNGRDRNCVLAPNPLNLNN